jgi:SAM-dependent methyltransferase
MSSGTGSPSPPAEVVIWHDLECGGYDVDLPVWRALAARHGDPILDVGAGTGRVALELARAGHAVWALDLDPALVAALRERAGDLPVTGLVGDGRELAIDQRFALCIVPMQTIQLLGGRGGRRRLLESVRDHLRPEGRLAVAIAEELDLFDVADGAIGPLPDVTEHGGTVYSSCPTAVRAHHGGYVLERRREIVSPRGELITQPDVIELDLVTADGLESEGRAAGLRPAGRVEIPASAEYTGSTVVVLGV